MFIKEFSIKTGLSIDTLRYYEEEGLLLPDRNDKNYRIYTEEDYCWVQLLLKMKQTGMALADIKIFAVLQRQGDVSLAERTTILEKHMVKLHERQAGLSETIDFVTNKIAGYRQKLS
ncbi:MerR family transcriptional regulator [Erwinia sp. CPCC 100877]|nr:MerR family transcriptional regulator [Erwinia sp. CPCC 100877]